MKYYIISGEASGDLHGSNLIKSLIKEDSNAEFRFIGGDLMERASMERPFIHYRNLSFMGFFEVIKNIFIILKYLKICKNDIKKYNPDVIILIDYPGFNFNIMKYAKNVLNIKKVYYYISPQLWAWKPGRIETIKKYVDKLFVILPFEEKWYKKRNFNNVYYVGHPLMDVLEKIKFPERNQFIKENNLNDKLIVSVLPGSRIQEINKNLPVMVSLIKEYNDFQFVIAKARSIDISVYQNILKGLDVKIVDDKTYDLLSVSHIALVTSGTATLETALIGIPQIVCYKSGYISYIIAKMLVRHIKYISLVNLIMDKEIVKELIQGNFNKEKLSKEFEKIISEQERVKIISNYELLRKKIKSGASQKVAEIICQDIG